MHSMTEFEGLGPDKSYAVYLTCMDALNMYQILFNTIVDYPDQFETKEDIIEAVKLFPRMYAQENSFNDEEI